MRLPLLFRSFALPAPWLVVALVLSSCDGQTARAETIVMTTTTSVEDTGLLDALGAGLRADLPAIEVRMVAVGTGQALEIARRGDADLVLVHDPDAESTFIAQGYGDRRRTIMRNDFVVVGPAADPAGIRATSDTRAALARIAETRSLFLSRGDSSGTHRREIALWRQAGIVPAGDWYREAGVGQGDLLRMASERAAYALVDRGTFRFHEAALRLAILHADDPPLDNPYSVIVVTGARNPTGAHAVADWLSGERARAIIAAHGVAEFGAPLFDVVANR